MKNTNKSLIEVSLGKEAHRFARKIEVPLGKEAHRFARKFAMEQATLKKRKQVYLNTLSVYAVRCYLNWLGIESDLSQSDSWNLILRNKLDVADLLIPEVGRLECRPVLPGEKSIALPTEVRRDRIGYLAVQFNEELDSVKLQGFAPIAAQFRLTSLQDLDVLIDCLNPKRPVRLSQWLQSTFNDGWQTIEALLKPEQIDWAFSYGASRSSRLASISRAKQIDLGSAADELDNHQAILAVTLVPETDRQMDVLIQIHPATGQTHLPPHLQLKIVDETGKTFTATASHADRCIQQRFMSDFGECFSLQLTLGAASITENFSI